VFAVLTGAGAVFAGDWWGQHHGPVVTVFVTPPASASRASHTTVAGSPRPAASRRTRTGSSVPAYGDGDAQADANTARVAHVGPVAPASHHPAKPPGPAAPATPGGTKAPGPVLSATPGGTETGPAPAGASAPVVTSSPVS
jgi:hypothetical protein